MSQQLIREEKRGRKSIKSFLEEEEEGGNEDWEKILV
jgi:hypothetical protein